MDKNILRISTEGEHFEDTNWRLRNIQYTQGLLAALIFVTDALVVLVLLAH